MADSVENAVVATVVKVIRVTVSKKDDKTNVFFKLDKALKKFKEDKLTGEFKEVEENELSMFGSKAVALAETDEMAAFLMSVNGDIYSQEILGSVFFGARLTVHSTLHHKGDVVNDKQLDRDKWFNDVVKFEMGDFAKKMIEKKLGI